ncbi:MAG: DEAD/DEAH box helicase [Acidimicrobiales bacterium]|nr:DEAD/DEAH box helicase [Acidimicrobiales bacterium]
MSGAANLISRPGTEAVFVPGRPARNGELALWSPARTPEAFTDTLDMVLPAGSTVRQRTVPVVRVALRDALDELVDLHGDAPCGASVHGWAEAARQALLLVAKGRLLPMVDEDGVDGWRLGPLDPDDLASREALADHLPPTAHAAAIAGSAPRRISSPRWLMARFWDAVADAYVRTAAAPLSAGHDAFASMEPSLVRLVTSSNGRRSTSDVDQWLTTTASSIAAQASVALRLEEAPSQEATTQDTADSDEGDGSEEASVEADLSDAGTFRAVLEVGSVSDRSLVLDAADLWTAPAAVTDRFGPTVEDEILLTLRRGSRAWEPLGRLLDQARPSDLELDGEEVADLLGPVADQLAGAGIEVRWPTTVLTGVELKPVVMSETVTADRAGSLDFTSLCEMRWTASLEGQELTPDELALLVEAKRGVVRLRGRWVKADPDRLARVRKRRDVSAGEALAAAISGELVVDGETIDAEVDGPLAELADRLATLTAAGSDRSAWTPPATLRAELRPYQREGAAWLSEMADLGLGGVLADDMGLGKTVQFLAVHLERTAAPDAPPTLVVCPVSVLGNWAREAARFAPSVPVLRYHGADRTLDHVPPGALVLTTYAMVRRDAEKLATVGWGLVAADEAQAVKNPVSRTARALRKVPAQARFALTGTPVENRLVDLWALLDWTTPGLLGSLDHFRREIAVPVERHRSDEATQALSRLVRPFLLRRRKSDPEIAPDLPPKTETDNVVPLTLEQRTLYQAMVTETMARVEEAEGMQRRGLVLKLLTGLKQICNHPAQFLKQDVTAGGAAVSGRSGKLDATVELVESICDEGDSVLVFTQFVAMGELLTSHLATRTRPTQFLHGGVPEAARQAMVDRFQAGEVPVFVISLKAGGTGLNLTRATHVIHYDRWWNPAVEDQASDRAWRIGQDRPVQVHRMVCEGTVEDKVATLLHEKRMLAESVITSGEGWVSELGDDDLRLLVSLNASDDGAPGGPG